MIPLMKNAFINESETKQALADFILRTEKFSMDKQCRSFELAFAAKQGRKEAILFNSGGSANLALLQAIKNMGRLRENANVGFSALTWSTNTMPIIQMGFNPVVLDCDPTTLNVMLESIEKRHKAIHLDAIFLTNVLGFIGDLVKIRTFCNDSGILLLEDNCESLGTETIDGKAGNFGLASTFSFFVAHHMSTIEGGMVCTDDYPLAEMLRIVRANGWDRNLTDEQQQIWRRKFNIASEFDAKYTFYELAYNFRPTEITGFLGLEQLKFLDQNIRIREQNYLKVEKIIVENDDIVVLNHDHINVLSTFALPFVFKTTQLRDEYLKRFIAADIEIRPMIAGNMQKQPFYKKYVKTIYDLPGTDQLHKNGFYCGNYPELSETDLQTIFSCIKRK